MDPSETDQHPPEAAESVPLDLDEGLDEDEGVVVQQMNVGKDNMRGGGEFPDPDTPPTGLVDYDPQRVPVNMYETDGAVVLVMPLPGVMADDVTIDIDDDRVHVNAAERTAPEKDYLAHEWHYGPYERMVSVPKQFRGPASATFGNGQLALRIERGDGRGDGKVVVRPTAAGT